MEQQLNRFFEFQKCKYCHKSASHYSTYKDSFAYLCKDEKCIERFDLETGIFNPGIEIKESE